jgi:hypothetical protein
MGRPSSFSQEKADNICDQLAEGLSLREVCRQDGMPSKSMVMRWLHEHPSFRDQYTRAKDIGIEAIAEDILDIADDAKNDWMERNAEEDRGWIANGENVRRSQIRIDARKWLLSKLAPKKYGDKLDLKHSGSIATPRELSDDDLARIASSGGE